MSFRKQLPAEVIKTLRNVIHDCAVWYDNVTQQFIAEINADIAKRLNVTILDVAETAKVQIKGDVQTKTEGDRVEAKVLITYVSDGIERTVFGTGEALLYINYTDKKTGEVQRVANQNAVRTAETRAFKRALDNLVPEVGEIMKRYSQAINYVAGKTKKLPNETQQQYIERLKKVVASTPQIMDKVFGGQT